MAERFTIDVVSDVICPWCFLGKRRLDVALAASPVLFGDTVILQCDELEQKSRLIAFDKDLDAIAAPTPRRNSSIQPEVGVRFSKETQRFALF